VLFMINYTDHVRLLMADVVSRVPALSHIDVREVLVFARLGRTSTHGAYATCQSLMVPTASRRTTTGGTGAPVR